MKGSISIFWFRRDLRLEDNTGLFHALRSENPVLPIFIFDKNILDELVENDARLNYIHSVISTLKELVQNQFHSDVLTFHDTPLDVFKNLIEQFDISSVYTNHDYEPYAMERDEEIKKFLKKNSIAFKCFKDQVIYEKNEVVKADGDPYVVFTPYKNKWLARFRNSENSPIKEYTSQNYLENLLDVDANPMQSLNELGFIKSEIEISDYDLSDSLIEDYNKKRNFPFKNATSRLGVHLRFGTISIRKAVQIADQASEKTFLSELIWREFFMQILFHYPHTVHDAFRAKYDRIEWRNNKEEFEKWKSGATGYLLVDAGMRELNQTGYMHNRVRMLVASFLCKHLLIDWRWGEAYFAEKLLDYELSSNVGNWQWAAGSGVDAAPYFRIFNPMTQVEKFDKNLDYIKIYVPEHDTPKYPDRIVDHKEARERCLKTYKAIM